MRKKILLTLSLLAFVLTTKAQDQNKKIELEKTIVSLNLLAPGISVESSISEQQSLFFNAAMSFYFHSETYSGTTRSQSSFSPYIMVQYRSYFNLDKRDALGKKTAYNSGNYWGIMLAHQGKPIKKTENVFFLNEEATTILGPVWGIQRNGTVSFGLSLGAGLYLRQSGTTGGLIGSFNLGINLSKKSK